MAASGTISIKHGALFYSLRFAENGWLAADLVQYLDEILRAQGREVAILKLLGYTMEVRSEAPPRLASHWVEIDLERRLLSTNSGLIRQAVEQLEPDPNDPTSREALMRIHRVLDEHDFTVELVS